MLKIICNQSVCKIIPTEDFLSDAKVVDTLVRKLSYIDNNKSFVKTKYRNTSWSNNINEEVSLYNETNHSFYTGLLSKVKEVLKYYMFAYEVDYIENPVKLKQKSVLPIPDWAYQHQQDIIRQIILSRRCQIKSPTGSGKSLVIAWLLQCYINTKALIIVPKINIAQQLTETLKTHTDLKIASLGGGQTYTNLPEEYDVLVGVTPSVAKLTETNPDLFQQFNMFIIDESHLGASDSVFKISNVCINALVRVGLSATPKGHIKEEAITGTLAFDISEQDLSIKEVILRPEYRRVVLPLFTGNYSYTLNVDNSKIYVDSEGVPTFNNKPEYIEVYNQAVVNNNLRNQTIVDLTKLILENKQRTGPIVIFVEWSQHGQILKDLFDKEEIACHFLNGATSNKERDTIFKGLKNEKIDLVIATNVIAEGTDIVNLQYCILADGRKAFQSILQKVGRIVRQAVGKTECFIYDIVDNEPFYLSKASNERYKAICNRHGACVKSIQYNNLTL